MNDGLASTECFGIGNQLGVATNGALSWAKTGAHTNGLAQASNASRKLIKSPFPGSDRCMS